MLVTKNISKIYRSGEIEFHALDGVSVNFRQEEFVSILGASGSGKTTLLNIIGGLDRYTDGDLIIDDVSTKEYVSSDWDAYRNHRVGFVFQSYNLISHQTALENVELALTLSGVSANERRERAKKALTDVGLEKFMNKRPSQLSGGQMQRVAIARAIVNNPDIILADEPTGALDSKTSVQIMELLKKIAKNKLVIMVTHNPELAKKYSTRIITLKDGKIIDDTKPFDGKETDVIKQKTKHSSLSLLTALRLSKNNLMTKRGRTLITAIAGSIGIIGIALILALSNGVNNYANQLIGTSTVASPITIQKTWTDTSTFSLVNTKTSGNQPVGDIIVENDLKNNIDINRQQSIRHNDTAGLKKYLDEHAKDSSEYIDSIVYGYGVVPKIFDKNESGEIITINPIDRPSVADLFGLSEFDISGASSAEVTEENFIKSSFKELTSETPYEIIKGKYPSAANELLLVLDQNGKMQLSTAFALNLVSRANLDDLINKINNGGELIFDDYAIDYDKIVGKKYQIEVSDDNMETLVVSGVAKAKKEGDLHDFMGYTYGLVNKIIAASHGQYDANSPESIAIYAKTEDDKKKVTDLLDAYNATAAEKIYYEDQLVAMVNGIKDLINMLSYVLIGFVAISLIVSSIMIGIITYISVLERTKEIGILRAIGASKRDVIRVFRAETIIEGFAAGLLGTVVSFILCLLINLAVSYFGKIDNITDFSIVQALILILISIILTVFAGAIPAKRASRKDPVEALRSE